jgi:SsrA-binding protein
MPAMNKQAAKDKGNSGAGAPKKKDKAPAQKTIALNKRAKHEYHLEERVEAGISLQGWELKAIRAGRANIGESYAIVKDGELFLFGAQITPLIMASSHVIADAHRTRKLLLHRREIDRLAGKIKEKGYTLVPLSLYEKKGRVKAELALVHGKQEWDKREDSKKRESQREIDRAMSVRRR